MRSVLITASALLCFYGCDGIPDAVDFSVNAQEGRDVTAILSGCGEGTHDGYLFCRQVEGIQPRTEIRMVFPKVTCDRQSCVEFQFFNLDGSPGYGAAVPRGDSSVDVPLVRILGHENALDPDRDDGEYQFAAKVYYKGSDGIERQMRADGLLRLWIVSPEYQSLFCNDPERGWETKVNSKCTAEFSTGYRSALCGECGKQ